jgi:hypothetical protein
MELRRPEPRRKNVISSTIKQFTIEKIVSANGLDDDYVPPANFSICHVHFTEDSYEFIGKCIYHR